jgi:hypothetical protein
MNNGNKFGDAKWRSPLTGSTSAEILVKRTLFRDNVQLVNRQIIAERERLAAIEEKANEVV